MAENLTFGRDIVFTYGPYGSVSTGAFDPEVRWLPLFGGAVLAAGFLCAALPLAARVSPWRSWLTSVVLLLGLVTSDAVLLLYPLVTFCAVAAADPGQRARRRSGVRLVVMVTGMGLLPLIKLSTLPPVVGGVLVCTVVFLRCRRWAAAAVVLAGPGVAASLLWLLSGQPAGALADFLQTFPSITGSYSEAMSFGTVNAARTLIIAGALLGTALLTVCVLVRRKPVLDRLLMALMLLGTLFMAWKSSFVRADVHMRTFTAVLVVVAVATIPLMHRKRLSILTATVVTLTVLAVESVTASLSVTKYVKSLREYTATTVSLGVSRVAKPGVLDDRYQAALADIRRDGTVVVPTYARHNTDIYSFGQDQLFARDVTWNPRPVFQSYAAYDSYLAELNAAHLTGDRAPEHILFRVESLESRLAATQDGPTTLPLLEGYHLDRYEADKDYALFTRRPHAETFAQGRESVLSGTIGRTLQIPSSGSGLLARVELDPTTLGKALNLLWRPPFVEITVTTADGGSFVRRFVPEMARAQFLLSPYVSSTADLASTADPSLYGPNLHLVTSIRIDVPGGGHGAWSKHYELRLRSVELPSKRP